MLFQMCFVLVQERKIAHTSFPPWWNDVIIYVIILLQEEKLACTRFPPWSNDVV
jgi:hypothetical protein